jgi:hypothetical protein
LVFETLGRKASIACFFAMITERQENKFGQINRDCEL